jgi:hypothetical protein
MRHARPWQPLRLITNGDARAVATGIIAAALGLYVALGGPPAGAVIFTGLQVVLIVWLGTWLGGKAGPDLSAAVEQGRQQGRAEAAGEAADLVEHHPSDERATVAAAVRRLAA